MKKDNYEPVVKTWEIMPEEQFFGANSLTVNYGFALTPPDPDHPAVSYFTVEPTLFITNDVNGKVFTFTVNIVYNIQNEQKKPSPEFLFEITKDSARVANKILKEKGKGSIVSNKEFPEPVLEHVFGDLIQQIVRAYPV